MQTEPIRDCLETSRFLTVPFFCPEDGITPLAFCFRVWYNTLCKSDLIIFVFISTPFGRRKEGVDYQYQ